MTATKTLRLAVLASGGGTNLQALIDHSLSGTLSAEIVLVFSNRSDAGALERAKRAGIPHLCIDHRQFSRREDFDRQVVGALTDAGAELVVLAGYMRIISEVVLSAFPGRVINIHPALLPAFPGLHVQRKALESGARLAGCTVHFVDGGVDTGPVILQAAVPILSDDDEESLSARILEQEHRIYPQAIQWIAEGRVTIEGRRVRIAQSNASADVLINPPLESF